VEALCLELDHFGLIGLKTPQNQRVSDSAPRRRSGWNIQNDWVWSLSTLVRSIILEILLAFIMVRKCFFVAKVIFLMNDD
jgi:hypothetical protein